MSESPNVDGFAGGSGVGKRQILHCAMLTGVMCLVWFIQIRLIYPVEASVRGEGLVDVFSLIFLPHGFKVILLSLMPVTGFLPVVFAQVIATIYLGTDSSMVFVMAVGLLAAFACVMPIWMVNLVMGRPWYKSPLVNSQVDFNSFRFMLALVFVAALLNAIVMSLMSNATATSPLPIEVVVGFVAGDLIGGCFVLICFAFLGNRLLERLNYGR